MAIYEMKPRLDNIDRRVLDVPIGEALNLLTTSLRDWIKRTSNVAKIGIQRANQRLKSGNKSKKSRNTSNTTPGHTQHLIRNQISAH
jgi:hypothetical protein